MVCAASTSIVAGLVIVGGLTGQAGATTAPTAKTASATATKTASKTAAKTASKTALGAGDLPSVVLGKGSALAPGSRIARYRTVNPCTRDYYMLRSWMEHFEAAGGGTLTLAPGTYTLSNAVYVPSHTSIILSSGTTLRKSGTTCTRKFKASSSMFMLVPPSLGRRRNAVGGYAGASDILISGVGDGTSVIDLNNRRDALAIIAGHNRGVTIQGIRFTNMNNNHFIEMDANADATIRGNEFLGATASTRMSAEAINLDTPDWLTHGFASIWSNHDGTPNLRVLIEGNVFADMVRGLGTHKFTGGRYHTGIVVRENVFRNMRNDAIRVMNWRESAIVENAFDEVWCPTRGNSCRGILASGALDLTVRDNLFSHMSRAIQFLPWRNGDEAAVYGVTYDELTEDNLLDLADNRAGPGLVRAAAIIDPQFGVFSHPRVIPFTS